MLHGARCSGLLLMSCLWHRPQRWSCMTHIGFRNRKCFHNKLEKYTSTSTTKPPCTGIWVAKAADGTAVSEYIGTAHQREVKENREYIKTLFIIILICAKTNLAVRGQGEILRFCKQMPIFGISLFSKI